MQLKVLNELGIGEDQKSLLRRLDGFVQSLVKGQFGQNLVETLNQFFRIRRQTQIHLSIRICFEVLVDLSCIKSKRHLIISKNGQIQAPRTQGLEHHLQAKLVTGALKKIGQFEAFRKLKTGGFITGLYATALSNK